jgi:hypothetical protein
MNHTFQRVFTLSNETGHFFGSSWLPTDDNWADDISRGEFGNVEWLEIEVELPAAVRKWASLTCESWA